MTPTHRTVTLATAGPREGPLTWGQLAIWDVLQRLPADDYSLNQSLWRPTAGPTTVDDAVGLIRSLIERHESLHSFYFTREGEPVQRITEGHPLHISVVRSEPNDVAEAAEAERERLHRAVFDLGSELPVRAAVVAVGEWAEAVVLALSHAAVDGWGLAIVVDELERLLAGCSPDNLGPRARQPIDRVAFELSNTGRRMEAATLAHWESEIRATPVLFQAQTDTPPEAERDWAEMDSVAAAICARRLSGSTGPAASVLAMTGALLAQLNGLEQSAMRVIVSTRYDRADWSFVGAMNQNAYVRVHWSADTSAARYLTAASNAAFTAYLACECDPRKVEALTAAHGAASGFVPQGYCFFNDTSLPAAPTPAEQSATLGLEDIEDALRRTRIAPLQRDGRQLGAKFFLYLQAISESCRITLVRDPAFLDVTAGEFLAALERLLVLAATEPDAPLSKLLQLARPHVDTTATTATATAAPGE